jgi:hypothetical protein
MRVDGPQGWDEGRVDGALASREGRNETQMGGREGRSKRWTFRWAARIDGRDERESN